jgi:hypothetical protein
MPQYQGVWTLEQQAQAQSNQQWVTDPNFKNTTLLLQADGTGSGSQNNTFLDGSTNNFFITRNGNTTQGSFSPFSQAPGYWSNYFDGNNTQLSTTSTAINNFGTGAYTVECWVYPTTFSAGAAPFIFGCPAVAGPPQLSINSSGTLTLGQSGGSNIFTTTGTLTLNAWNHVALVRTSTSSNATVCYINGAIAVTTTDATNWSSTTEFKIGTTSSGGSTFALTGYVSNFRVCKAAVYSGAFTPSTSPLTTTSQGASSCVLLTCQNNRFLDNSATATAFTTATALVQAFGPFAPALQWTPDVVGGSGYFDGTGDYLKGTTTAIGSGNFTIECWIYVTSLGSDRQFIQMDVASTSTNVALAMNGSGNTVRFLIRNDATTTNLDINSSVALVANTWYHIAGVANSTTGTLYVNGSSTLGATGTITGSRTGTGTQLRVGVNTDDVSRYMIGYISSSRIVVGTAVYTSNFTPPTAPVTAISGTSALLNYTNAGIYDGKMANNLETVGNTQVSTSVVKYGSGSMYFNGSTSYLRSQVTSPLFAIGTTYTIEGWFYRTSNTSSGSYPNSLVLIGTQAIGVTCTGFFLTFNTSGVLNFYDGANATVISYASATTLIPLNQWNHIAIVRAGGGSNNVTLFVNGIAVSTGTSSSAQSTAQSYFIGGDTNGQGCFTGYMDDVRVTVGVARYFANFTPPQQALPRQ